MEKQILSEADILAAAIFQANEYGVRFDGYIRTFIVRVNEKEYPVTLQVVGDKWQKADL